MGIGTAATSFASLRSNLDFTNTEVRPLRVFGGNIRYWEWPIDSDLLVVVTNTTSRLRRIPYRYQVIDEDVIAQRLEAVSKSSRDIDLISAFARKLELQLLAIRRRLRSDINDNIPDGASETTHDFHLAVRLALKVHAPYRALVRGIRNAVLRIACLEPMSRELVNAKRSGEISAAVMRRLQLNPPCARERGRTEPHELNSRYAWPRYFEKDRRKPCRSCAGLLHTAK